MSAVDAKDGAARVCVTCGQTMTHVGTDGECMRCLISFGFLAEEQQAEIGAGTDKIPRRGPLRYAHFEVEVNADGYPKILGSGAMAITYCARDTILNSIVALKVIGRKLAENERARARFLREARAASQIQHPNVARVIHYGEQDGECFYAMELIEGETLEERVRRDGPMPVGVALEITLQVARALLAAEKCSVVHRDLKPSNIMIGTYESGRMLVRVIDYGVAKVLAPGTDSGVEQTQAEFIGTPAFASPEQFNAAGHRKIDARSDIYSLGTVLWYLLTGRAPFSGGSIGEIRARQSDPLPLHQLKSAHVPAQVVALLKSMLAIDPAKRPQSARGLLEAVQRCFRRFEPTARSQRKRLLLAAGLLLAVGLVSLAILVYERTHAPSALDRAIAVLPFDNLSSHADDQFLAIGIQDEILTKLASLPDLKVIARTSTQGYQGKQVDLRAVGRQLGVGRVLEGSVQRSGDKVRVNVQLIDTRSNAHVWASSYDRELHDVFAFETEIANAVAQQLDANLVQRIRPEQPTASTAAYNAYLRGLGIEHSQSGISSFQAAAEAYAEAVQLDPRYAVAWARLSLARGFLYLNGVERNVNSALAVKEAANHATTLAPQLGETWLAQGAYRYRVLRDHAGALEAYREAEKRLPNSALVNEYMVYTECRLGRWQDAEAHLAKATSLDPLNLRLWTRAAQGVFRPLRRFPEAQAALDRALEIAPDHEYAITAKAELFQEQGRLEEAAKELRRLRGDSLDSYVLLIRAAQALFERKFDLAISWSDQVTRSVGAAQSPSDQHLFGLVVRGYAQRWAGRHEDARATFERIIRSMAPSAGFVIPAGTQTRSFLAMAYAGVGDKERALEEARQAVAENENDAVTQPIAEANRAKVLAESGELDAALAALPHLVAVPGGIQPGDLRFSPYWDPLRKDPRFDALVKNPPR